MMLLRAFRSLPHHALTKPAALPVEPKPLSFFLEGHSPVAILGFGFILVFLVGALNHATGPEFSCAIFYLFPIGLGAWWGGFPHGILLSLASTIAWNVVEGWDAPFVPLPVGLWNGVIRFGCFAITSSLLSRLRSALQNEQALARTDPLTGVANGRTFFERARWELHRFVRSGRPFTLVYLDLDDFKVVNDRLGHLVGDELLRRVAQVIRENTRATDVISRLGGDEFALLLPETDAPGALSLLGRLRQSLSRICLGDAPPVTCSIGAATFREAPRDVDSMIQRVDKLMYAVKKNGKNQIRHCIIESESDDEPGGRERRASVRHLCERAVRVSDETGPEGEELLARVCDLSVHGVGFQCDAELPLNTLVTVEALGGTRIRALLARVVRRQPTDNGWFYGCSLAQALRKEELTDWNS